MGLLSAVGRFGLGQVWETRSDISLRGPRTGYGLGLVHPSRFGPLSMDLGFTGVGAVRFTFAVGPF